MSRHMTAVIDSMLITQRNNSSLNPLAASLASACVPSTLGYTTRHIRIIAFHGRCWHSKAAASQSIRQRKQLYSRKVSVCRASETSGVSEAAGEEAKTEAERKDSEGGNGAAQADDFPSGDLEYRKMDGLWDIFLIKLKMLIALPWQRVKKGSILKLKISGEITEQLQGPFSRGLSLPQICKNLIKASHDPRVTAVIVQVEPLSCGWPKIEEIIRHIEYYKQSGKPLVSYLAVGGEKEYYLACACGQVFAPPGAYIFLLGLKVEARFYGGVLEKVGVEPQIERIGKYKSAGDSLARKDMSDANREMLTAILDDVYRNWLDRIASFRGKSVSDVEKLLDTGVFEIEKLREQGWINDIKYEDEMEEMLKTELGMKEDQKPKYVGYRKYSRVKEWTLGLAGGKADIAVLRAVGNISLTQGGLATGGGISSDKFVEQIRQVRENKNFKAVVLRIDSPGGDSLASDLMWRELRLLAAKKPVIASMVDVAASGGYYMAMAAGTIVAEDLTLTGSIGVLTGRPNLGKLYERIGLTKEVISRGKFAELGAEQRPFRPEEAEFFAKSAKNAYSRFRNKAALSRSMEIERMEEVAQGRVWTGKAALTHGLIDTVGGFHKAVAIAKQKAGISPETKVRLVELSRKKPNLLALLRGGVQVMSLLTKLFQQLIIPDVQTTMEDIDAEGRGSDMLMESYEIEAKIAELLNHLLR